MNLHIVKKGLRIFFFVVVGMSVIGWVVMSLWNWLMPELLGAPEINFIQAWGLLILCKILFGSTGNPVRGKEKEPGKYWRKKLADKLANMSAEEREQIRKQLKGYDAGTTES